MRQTLKKVTTNIVLLAFLSGCAASPDSITGTYVSPLQYSTYSCDQIKMEMMRVSRKVSEVTGQQQKARTKDAWALGVGLVLFWPAIFFMIGGDKKEELAHLKGEFDALESAAIQKECSVVAEIEAGRKEAERQAEEKRKELEEKNRPIEEY